MKRAITYGLAGFVTVIAIILLIAAFQPKDWRVERSVTILAPKDQVWAIVSDLHRYNEWNAFYLMEPEAKTDAQGPAATVGSSYSWDGQQSGAGSMTTTALKPSERMDFRLDFTRPMVVTNSGAFILSDLDGATKMSWEMSGHHEGFTGLIARALHMFVNMDDMLGKTFETGLAHLKEISEKKP